MAGNDMQGNAFAAYQRKILEITQTNAQAAFEFGKALTGCRAPEGLMNLTQDYTKKQTETFQQQANELMELAKKPGG